MWGLWYGMDDRGSVLGRSNNGSFFSLFHIVQTDSGAHPASNARDVGGPFPGLERPWPEIIH
jgi:hypothetical protein